LNNTLKSGDASAYNTRSKRLQIYYRHDKTT
jgi:hypothetical protein